MILIADAKQKIKDWAELNLIRKIPGEGKRALAAVIANRVIDNAETFLSQGSGAAAFLSGSGILRDGYFDETALAEIREALGAGKFEFSVPLVGTFSLDGEAVDSLYQALVSEAASSAKP